MIFICILRYWLLFDWCWWVVWVVEKRGVNMILFIVVKVDNNVIGLDNKMFWYILVEL